MDSGLYYYGARYYDPRTSVWLEVDPKADKYPGWSPYVYCMNNPVKLIDPDGKTPWPVAMVFNGGIRSVISGMYRNSSGTFHGGVDIVHMSNNGNLPGGAIIATHGGKVTASGLSETAGNWVQITNGDIRTSYMHMEKASGLKVGQDVKEFDFIGNVGSTGRSEGPHVHYQIEKLKEDTKKWEKINPVEGDLLKVDKSMNVDLKDPQIMINNRDATKNMQNPIHQQKPQSQPTE